MINHSELTLMGADEKMGIIAEALSRKTSTLTAYEQGIQHSLQTHLCRLTHLMKNSRQTRPWKTVMSREYEMENIH